MCGCRDSINKSIRMLLACFSYFLFMHADPNLLRCPGPLPLGILSGEIAVRSCAVMNCSAEFAHGEGCCTASDGVKEARVL
jgi:hypothetical protein